MTRPVIYMAHPLGGDVEVNLRRAYEWLAWLMRSMPNAAIVAPWIACVASGADDDSPAQRERGLLDAEAVIARCDGIVLCGGRVSSGMERELDAACRGGIAVYDLMKLGTFSPVASMDVEAWRVGP